MAGDWVKIEKDTPDKAEVLAIAEDLGVTPEFAFVACFRVWSWAESQTASGYVRNVTIASLDKVARVPNFSQALIKVGWLRVRDNALEFPNFDRHMSKGAKARALAARRMEESRGKSGENVALRAQQKRNQRREEKSSLSSAKPKKEKSRRKPNPLFDAIVDVTGFDPDASAPFIQKICTFLKESNPPYGPDEVRALPKILRDNKFTFPVTPGVIHKYIGWTRNQPVKGDGLSEAQILAEIRRDREEFLRIEEENRKKPRPKLRDTNGPKLPFGERDGNDGPAANHNDQPDTPGGGSL